MIAANPLRGCKGKRTLCLCALLPYGCVRSVAPAAPLSRLGACRAYYSPSMTSASMTTLWVSASTLRITLSTST